MGLANFPRFWFAVVLALSVACGFVPLLNYLGFEYSFLAAIVLAYAGGMTALRFGAQFHQNTTQLPADEKKKIFSSALWPSVQATLVLVAASFVVSLLTAFFVRNCSFLQGMLWFLLLTVPGALFGASLGIFLSVILPSRQRLALNILFFGILAWTIPVTFMREQIFAFNPVFGFFPGVTYDESLISFKRVALYRGTTLVAILALMRGAYLLFVRNASDDIVTPPLRRFFIRAAALLSPREFVLYAVIFLAVVWCRSDRYGFSSSSEHIRAELGGKAETERVILYYPAQNVTEREAEILAELHEYTAQKLEERLEIEQEEKIVSYVYASAAQKARLTGAGGTNFAKPWLKQIHINLADVENTLLHEMTHVSASRITRGFPGVPLNQGLIEGLAMAMEETDYGSHLHDLAAASVIDLGMDEGVEKLFTLTGFASQSSTRAYVLAGSFSLYLIEVHGMDAYKALYATGNFPRAYGKPLDELIAEWKFHLHRYMGDRAAAVRARYLFSRRPIFSRECPRTIAALNEQARKAMAERRFESARDLSLTSYSMTGNPDAAYLHITALNALGAYEEAVTFFEAEIKKEGRELALMLCRLPYGDALFAQGKTEPARRQYERIAFAYLGTGWLEAASLRLHSNKDAGPLFAAPVPAERKEEHWQAMKEYDSLTAGYYLAKELLRSGKPEEAARQLEQGGQMRLPDGEYFRLLLLGESWFRAGNKQRALTHFWNALNYVPDAVQEHALEEWIERCGFNSALHD